MAPTDLEGDDPLTPSFSIVIRAYNEEKHIGRLLTGVLAQTLPPAEIILVDSGSTDSTLAIASRFPVRVVTIRPDDFSFGRSLNLGITSAAGDLIVIASAHVYPVYPDWLEQLLAPFEEPTVGLSYGKQRGDSSTRYSEHQILSRWFPDASSVRSQDPFCNNANAAIRRSLWDVRPYDEELPGLEDLDWATWAIGQGHRIAYVSDAEVVHVHSETPTGVYNRYRREAMALKRIHPEEHFRVADLMWLYLFNVTSDLWHAGQEGQLPQVTWEVLWFRWMQFWGTYRGFRQAGPLTGALKRTFYYPRSLERHVAQCRRELAPIDYRREGWTA